MSNFERTTSWQQIQQGVKEAERLIVSKDYNLVMVKARQTLECMVRCLAEKACLVDGDLADTIDQLYEGHWIDKTTKDDYHTIRILGNKAVHENDNTAYNANQAYQLLTKQVYAFSHDFQVAKTFTVPVTDTRPVRNAQNRCNHWQFRCRKCILWSDRRGKTAYRYRCRADCSFKSTVICKKSDIPEIPDISQNL